jgi:hypothetical protein
MTVYKVMLTQQERDQLNSMISKGEHTAQEIRNAAILLNADQSVSEEQQITVFKTDNSF